MDICCDYKLVSPTCTGNVDADDVTAPEEQSPTSASSSPSKVKRTVFTRQQLSRLEDRFIHQTFLSREERRDLAKELGLTDRQVMIWYQNRRGRLKRRGHHDTAYSQEKLKELNQRRPYPFLYGILSSLHHKYPHHPYQNIVDQISTPEASTCSKAPSAVINYHPETVAPQVSYPCLVQDTKSVLQVTKNPVERVLTQVDLAVELNIPDIMTTLTNSQMFGGFPSQRNHINTHSLPVQLQGLSQNYINYGNNQGSSDSNIYRNLPIQ